MNRNHSDNIISPTRNMKDGHSIRSTKSHVSGMTISGDISEHFNKKAVQNMRSIVRGRHPKSIPRDSELWHYSKLSAERRTRINKGHQFWDVVAADDMSSMARSRQLSPLMNHHDGQYNYSMDDDSLTQCSSVMAGFENTTQTSHNNSRVSTSSINTQLKQLMSNKSNSNIKENLLLKIDFKNKGQINFGMSFIIMNYMNEILYVNKYGELRCKDMNLIEPTDRIKFKMIDLVNPSNPSSLKFGDSMWLQCLDSSEQGDNSFQAGHVLSAKLYGPPELKSMQFDINAYTKKEASDIINDGIATLDPDGNIIESEQRMRPISKPEPEKSFGGNGFSVPMFTADSNSPMHNGRNRLETDDFDAFSSFNSSFCSPDRMSTARSSLDWDDIDEHNEHITQVDDVNNIMNPTTAHSQLNGTTQNDAQLMRADGKSTYAAKKNTSNSQSRGGKRDSNVAKICGEVSVTRIIELRKGEAPFVHDSMSDEKATRYNSKQSIHLGRWAVHTAMRNDGRITVGQTADGTAPDPSTLAQGKRSSRHAAPPNNYVYSLSPIVIQQDLYCIGSSHPQEFHKWPMNSHSVIKESESITTEDATLLNEFYEKNGGGSKNKPNLYSTSAANSAINNLFNFEVSGGKGKGGATTTDKEKGDNKAGATDKTNAITGANNAKDSGGPPGTADTKANQPSLGPTLKSQVAATSNAATLAAADAESETQRLSELSDFGCLRKLVTRGFPYDYTVDRKCVWKFCLFEQFSDHNSTLSEKEKKAQKVMETASMALKLSQMNRAALVGGETFSRNLREIIFKNTVTGDTQHLQETRQNAQQLGEYFKDKIAVVLNKEEDIMKNGLHRAQSISNMSVRSMNTPSNSHNNSALNLKDINNLQQNSTYSSSSSLNSHSNSNYGLPPHPNRVAFAPKSGFSAESSTNSSFSPSKKPSSPYHVSFYKQPSRTHGSSASLFSVDEQQEEVQTYNQHRDLDNQSVASNLTLNTQLNAMSMSKQSLSLSPINSAYNSQANTPKQSVTINAPQVYVPSKEIQAVFHSNAHRIQPRQLLLNNSDSLTNFDKLSAGEQVLALHKTFSSIKSNAEAIADKRKPAPFKSKISAGVQQKLDRLLAEDGQIANVLSYKDRIQTMRRAGVTEDETY